MERTIKDIFEDTQSKSHGSMNLSLASSLNEKIWCLVNSANSLVSKESTYRILECVYIHPDSSWKELSRIETCADYHVHSGCLRINHNFDRQYA